MFRASYMGLALLEHRRQSSDLPDKVLILLLEPVEGGLHGLEFILQTMSIHDIGRGRGGRGWVGGRGWGLEGAEVGNVVHTVINFDQKFARKNAGGNATDPISCRYFGAEEEKERMGWGNATYL